MDERVASTRDIFVTGSGDIEILNLDMDLALDLRLNSFRCQPCCRQTGTELGIPLPFPGKRTQPAGENQVSKLIIISHTEIGQRKPLGFALSM